MARHLARGEAHRVVLDVAHAHLGEARNAAVGEVTDVSQGIAPIVGDGVRRRAPLDAQIVHPLMHEGFQGRHGVRVSEISTNVRDTYARAHIFANM